MYMMVLMSGQSLMVTGFTVTMLHTKNLPVINVLHEAISYCWKVNNVQKIDCRTHHGTQLVCKI